MAAALPFIAVAATVGAGVMAYSQQQAAADTARLQAEMYAQQAEDQAKVTQLEMAQIEVEAKDQELAARDEANRLRRAAYRLERQAYGAQAAHGLLAAPFGSFGAILGDARSELFRDLEATRRERELRAYTAVSDLAGSAIAGSGAMESSRYSAAVAEGQAQQYELQSYGSLLGTATSAIQLM